MAPHLEAIKRQALGWPRGQRLELARILLEPDPNQSADVKSVEAAWEEEIRARVRAVEENRAVGIPLEKIRQEMEARLAR